MADYNLLINRLNNIREIQVLNIGRLRSGYPVYLLSFGTGDKKVILSAGVHGDEPAGVEVILRFLEIRRKGVAKRTGEKDLRGIKQCDKEYQFTILPCTNPTGYERGTRENATGVDLNRRFGSKDPPEEVAIIQDALKGRKFDLHFDFHEDIDGEGFYLYEVPREGGNHLAEKIIQSISRKYPIDLRERIDGFPNCGGIICPFPLMRSNLPLPLYIYLQGTGHCLTIETPTKFPLEERVGMHLLALDVALRRYSPR